MTEGQRTRVAVFGCTGSIGTQTLDVCRQHSDRLEVTAITCHGRTEALVEAAREFGVAAVGVTDRHHAADPVLDELPEGCELITGMDALREIAQRDDVDVVMVSVVGAAGLLASDAVLRSGKRLALANKESLVVGGDLLMPLAAPGQLLPVDSEHSAIFQCLEGERRLDLSCIWLTCSGGPFRGRDRGYLKRVTPAEALRHPTWHMGAKISIDSATLMNKGLERIEAMHLFGLWIDDIIVLVQPQSQIHSMVEFVDGSVKAHLGVSDMRIPIQYALSYPERWSAPAPRLDFRSLGPLEFEAPDVEAFRCLALAERSAREGGTSPCVLNAANEIAVDAFLAGACSLTDIDEVVERVLDEHDVVAVESLEQLRDIDAWARSRARAALDRTASSR